jgi:NAD-dependent epimerase/dehydratase family protein
MVAAPPLPLVTQAPNDCESTRLHWPAHADARHRRSRFHRFSSRRRAACPGRRRDRRGRPLQRPRIQPRRCAGGRRRPRADRHPRRAGARERRRRAAAADRLPPRRTGRRPRLARRSRVRRAHERRGHDQRPRGRPRGGRRARRRAGRSTARPTSCRRRRASIRCRWRPTARASSAPSATSASTSASTGCRRSRCAFGNVYGPRQDPHGEAGVIAIFCGRLREGARPRIFGDGRQTRDYIYVADLVQALLSAGDSDAAGVVNIGTEEETSVLDIVARLAELHGPDAPEPEFARPRGWGRSSARASTPGARGRCSGGAQTPLAEGLRLTFAALEPA